MSFWARHRGKVLIGVGAVIFYGLIVAVMILHGQTRLGPSQSPAIVGGPSGVIDCSTIPGQCDWVKAAMEQYAFTWQGAHQFEQKLTLKCVPTPSIPQPQANTPKPGYAFLYCNSDDKRLHMMDDTGQDWGFAGVPSATAKKR